MSGGGNAGGLVPYSDSDASGEGEESAEAGKQPLRKRCRVAASTKNQEGRRFPAVAGNWQTHIRIQCKLTLLCQLAPLGLSGSASTAAAV